MAISVKRLARSVGQSFAGAVRPTVRMKIKFFDRSIIKRNWSKMNRVPLQRAGLLVRKIARQSIRKAKKKLTSGKSTKPSQPGRPPKSKSAGHPLKLIFAAPRKLGSSIIVGMVGFGGSNPVPGLHESGGQAKRIVFVETTKFKFKHTKKTSGKFAAKTVSRKRVAKFVRYPKRPTMVPALGLARSKMPQLWKGSLK